MVDRIKPFQLFNKRIEIITLFVCVFVPLLIYLWAFWPGLMSYDSITQWKELSTYTFTDWHPVFHTYLMWLITRIWYHPASVAIVQILALSGASAYGLCGFRKCNVPFFLLLVVALCFSVLPLVGMIGVTLWKDILYGCALLFLTGIFFRIVISGGTWLEQRGHWLSIGITGALVALFRHNGFPVIVGSLVVMFFLFRRQRAKIVLAFGIFILLWQGIYTLLKISFDITPEKSQAAGIVFIHPIDAYMNAGVNFKPEEIDYLNQLYPVAQGWPYNCYDATVLFYSGVNFTPVQENPMKAANILLRLVIEHPKVIVKHFYCLSSFVWDPFPADGNYLETVILSNDAVSLRSDFEKYKPVVQKESLLPGLRGGLINKLLPLVSSPLGMIFWRPAFYLYIFLIALIIAAVRFRNWKLLVLSLPVLTHSAIIMFVTQLQAVRYQYPVYLVSLIFTVPLFFMKRNDG